MCQLDPGEIVSPTFNSSDKLYEEKNGPVGCCKCSCTHRRVMLSFLVQIPWSTQQHKRCHIHSIFAWATIKASHSPADGDHRAPSSHGKQMDAWRVAPAFGTAHRHSQRDLEWKKHGCIYILQSYTALSSQWRFYQCFTSQTCTTERSKQLLLLILKITAMLCKLDTLHIVGML